MGRGRLITDWKLRHADIVKGGGLVFEMAAVLPPVNAVVVQDAPGYNAWPMIQAFGTNLVCVYSRDSRLPADGHNIDPGSRDSYARVSAHPRPSPIARNHPRLEARADTAPWGQPVGKMQIKSRFCAVSGCFPGDRPCLTPQKG